MFRMLRSITRRPNFLLSPSTRIQQRSFTIPYVIEREGAAERTYDIFARLLKDRIVCIMGGIDDRVSAAVVAQLLFLSLDQPDAPIKMYINSPGGVVTSGMAIYDTMQMVPSPIETWCMGQACSMGSLLLTAGTPGQRYALPNSRVMIHQPSGGAQGQATDILIQAAEIEKMKKTLTQIYVTHNSKDKTYDDFYQALERDNFMSANEAMDFGLIDCVPSMTVPKPPMDEE